MLKHRVEPMSRIRQGAWMNTAGDVRVAQTEGLWSLHWQQGKASAILAGVRSEEDLVNQAALRFGLHLLFHA